MKLRVGLVHDHMCLALCDLLCQLRPSTAESAPGRAVTLMGMANIGYVVSLSLVVFPKASAVFKVWWPIAGVGALLYVLWGDRRLKLKMAARRATERGDSGHAEDPLGPWRSIAVAYVMVAFVLPFVVGFARWALVTQVQVPEASLPAQ